MLSVFKLTEAIQESANSGYAMSAVEPYEFIGTMSEAVHEFNANIMTEAVDVQAFIANSDEIMIEAAISNPDRISVIAESVIDTIRAKLDKFFQKLKSMIKGIIDKIKAYFAKLTGKTDKWYKIMEPKVKDAMKKPGYDKQTYEMHNWDADYVTKGMLAAVAKLVEDDKLEYTINDAEKMTVNIDKFKDTTANDASKAFAKTLEDGAKEFRDALEEYKSELPDAISKELGFGTANTMDDVWADVTKKATGGEKTTITLSGSLIEAMLGAIKNSKTTISDLEKAYKKHYDNVNKAHEATKKSFAAVDKIKDENKYPTEVTSAVHTYLSAMSAFVTAGYSTAESACNTAQSMNVKFVENMSNEYMSALSRFAGFKGEKKEK